MRDYHNYISTDSDMWNGRAVTSGVSLILDGYFLLQNSGMYYINTIQMNIEATTINASDKCDQTIFVRILEKRKVLYVPMCSKKYQLV